MNGRRKKPFSGKQKREQLKEKRLRKAEEKAREERGETEEAKLKEARDFRERKRDAERYFIRFINISAEEVEKNKLEGTKPFLESRRSVDFRRLADPDAQIPLFSRPEWTRGESKETIDERETKLFEKYIMGLSVAHKDGVAYDDAGIDTKAPILGPESLEAHEEIEDEKQDTDKADKCKDITARPSYDLPPDLSYFETNLNVIRQFWRAAERSQCILLVCDARFPLVHCPGNVLRYFGKKGIAKPVIIVLNKSDLCPKEHVEKWVEYLKKVYQMGDEKSEFTLIDVLPAKSLDMLTQKSARREFTGNLVNKFREFLHIPAPETLTICLVGQPSVGKSSLLNGILGRKAASTKQTPGLTKHFQTHFVPVDEYINISGTDNDSDEEKDNGKDESSESSFDFSTAMKKGGKKKGKKNKKNKTNKISDKDEVSPTNSKKQEIKVVETSRSLCLCDSPGFVFPILGMPKSMQIMSGVFPLSRAREFLSPARDLVECFDGFKSAFMSDTAVNLPEFPETPTKMLEGIAEKRGYKLKGGRLDVHRAGMLLLNRVINGQIAYMAEIPKIDLK